MKRSEISSSVALLVFLISAGAEDLAAAQTGRGACASPPLPSRGNSKGGKVAGKRVSDGQRAALLQQRTRGSDIAVDAVSEGSATTSKTSSKGAPNIASGGSPPSTSKDKRNGGGHSTARTKAASPTFAGSRGPMQQIPEVGHVELPVRRASEDNEGLQSGVLSFFQTGSDENDSYTDENAEDDNESEEADRATEAVSRLPPMEATMRTAAMTMFGVLAVLGIAATACGVMATGAVAVKKNLRTRSSSVRQRAQQVRVTSSVEIQSMFAIEGHRSEKHQPQSSSDVARRGSLMRVQGKVALEPEATQLLAPLSGRPCAIYSASTSHNRSDGVHQPPVAFHSAGIDFTIELLGSPSVSIAVHSQDVSLFDMASGRLASERPLDEAPDAWRAFTLAHLTPRQDAANCYMARVDAGEGGQGPIEFCECALPIGSLVTCIGEVARDRNGGLHLYPWRPPSTGSAPPQLKKPWFSWAFPRLATSWNTQNLARGVALATKHKAQLPEVQPRDSLANFVFISDEPALLL